MSRKRLISACAFAVLFFAWFVAAIYAVLVTPPRSQPGSWLAYVITNGVPLAMLGLSIFYFLSLPRVVKIDSASIQTFSPLGVKQMAWEEVSGYNVDGRDTSGIILFCSNGKKLGIEVGAFDAPLSLRDCILPRVPPPDPKIPLHTRGYGATILPIVSGCILLFFGLAISILQKVDPAMFVMVGMMAALLLPLSAYAATYRASLEDSVLRSRSCFGSKMVILTPGVQVKTERFNGKGGPSERLLVKGEDGQQIALASRMPFYPAFRTLILAAVGQPEIDAQ